MYQALIIISITLLSGYSLLLLYFHHSWSTIPYYKPQTPNLKPQTPNLKPQTPNQQPLTQNPQHPTSITVIVPARNEEKNIISCLNSVMEQSYPHHLFEVLIVDDYSTDKTFELVNAYKADNIRLIRLGDHVTEPVLNSFKKKAIEVAISQSTSELIVTTDADCLFPPDWLQTIAAYYETHRPVFMVMPVSFVCKNNVLEIFQALDFMSLQGITGAAVNKRMLSMCNGANLAYTRKAFLEVEGFKGIDNIASGDDMLLMHKIFTHYPTGIKFIKARELIVETPPMHTIKDFFNQRIRWASKAPLYDDKRIFAVLLLVYLLNCFCLLMGIGAFFSSPLLYWALGLLVGKTIFEIFFLYPVAVFFKSTRLLWWFPLAQPFHIIYTILAGWLGKFGNYQWKGRNVK